MIALSCMMKPPQWATLLPATALRRGVLHLWRPDVCAREHLRRVCGEVCGAGQGQEGEAGGVRGFSRILEISRHFCCP
jgi:hypothetical protein